ncbi:MAG: trypsin-like peptidase domain-containing protein [Actinomycetia bacterium]|nr:trypsin-like peptidase domain-containing protein [Actinomycetes bacterium]
MNSDREGGPPQDPGTQSPGCHGGPVPGGQAPPGGVTPPPARPPSARQGGQGAGIPPSGTLPPIPRRTETSKRRGGGATFLTTFIAGVVGALLVLTAMPWAFGVNPWDLVRGELRNADVGEDKEGVVKVVSPTEGATHVADIAVKVTPSIVNIDIRTAPQRGFFFDMGPQEGTGSGVIYKEDGYVITNNHVIQNAQEITVRLSSGQEITGTKVGADPDTDIAVVKIDKAGLPTLTLGDSDKLVVGELCVAVGSPFGFEQSVTAGIISALNRNISADSQDGVTVLTDLIQTDAAINPGNSGGALCDSSARLIGINAIIASAAGGSEGVGFAIPINTAQKVADDIIAGRPVSHPYIGILGQTVTDTIAEQYDLPVSDGAYITRAVPEGPADKAGIKSGDIIVEIDGKPVKGMDEIISEVRGRSVGDTVSLTYYDGNEKKKADVTLEEKPKNLQ